MQHVPILFDVVHMYQVTIGVFDWIYSSCYAISENLSLSLKITIVNNTYFNHYVLNLKFKIASIKGFYRDV